MHDDSFALLALLFLIVGACYASVGHAGASGYLAVMAVMGVDAAAMRPVALLVNVVVATIASAQFAAAGHASIRFLLPFALASVPAAFVGGWIVLPVRALSMAIGAILLLTAARMAWVALRSGRRAAGRGGAPHPAAAGDPELRESEKPREVSPAARAVAGGAIGFVAGLTGTGGGIFLSPLLLVFGWALPHRVAATAALFILANSLAGLGGILARGWTPPTGLWLLAAAAAVGGTLGSTYGSRRATPKALNLILAAVLVVAGAKLIARAGG
ncbi:MAG TPA: sulfite exporter TauE/SafE family protein [Phycisphaerales bacterium]|nr:sulfite exporter TauE/SafE family protein [Phycisphaerales bacterium]HMP36903.1 sulfite exporter TauE/SafE family protein [Phycisphaerales bacterium]